jgi:hypothetical protein
VTPVPIEIEPKLAITAEKCGCVENILGLESSTDEIVAVVSRASAVPYEAPAWRVEKAALDQEAQRLGAWLRQRPT